MPAKKDLTKNTFNKEYKVWLTDIKTRVRNAQIKAAVSVNVELLNLYWSIGADIVEKQKKAKWGDGLIDQLSKDLTAEFPDMKGFSRRNLEMMRQWYRFWSGTNLIAKQAATQLEEPVNGQKFVAPIFQIPWWHNVIIVSKIKNIPEALFYVQNTIQHNWSRSVLVHQMESGFYRREGKAISNFRSTLPKPQSDLAHQILKDPYVFDFLDASADSGERDLEKGLIEHLKNFLLELGAGFAFIGRQVAIQVGTREFFMDLLFYHARLHCYVVVELKTADFEPEHVGKLNFYIKAVDSQMRKEGDSPTIGLLLCKGRDKLVAEYVLSDIHKPMGVSQYQLTQSLPKNLKASLPAIKDIEKELSRRVK